MNIKKIISKTIVLAIAANLMASLCVASADTFDVNENLGANMQEVSNEINETTVREIEMIQQAIPCDSIQVLTDYEESGGAEYLLQSEGAPDAYVSIEIDDLGNIKYIIVEGTIRNEAIVMTDGTIYLDGNQIMYETNGTSAPSIMPMARWSMYDDEPIRGTAADYNKYLRTETGNVEFQKKIINIAAATIKLILSACIPAFASLSSAMVNTLAIMIKNDVIVKGPDSSFITYKIDVYDYKEKIPLEYHEKYVGRYYYTDNYTGPYTTYTYYYANMFS